MKIKFLPLLIVVASAQFAPLGGRAVADEKMAAGVESDPRRQSEGNGWRLDQAEIVDKSLPRVLCIGDSILGGYQKPLMAKLKGLAYVDAWIEPYNQGHMQGTYLSSMIEQVLAKGPYDVITFNMGLHGWDKGRIPEGQFIPLTTKLVTTLRANAPKAQLIWLSTTPITGKDERPEYWKLGPPEKPYGLNTELNPIIIEHNRMAALVMADQKVPIVDLYTLMTNDLGDARGDMFHWKDPAYVIMADAIVGAVKPYLPKKTAGG